METSKTTISAWSVNPAPYCRFSSFMQDGAQISLFDARRYTPNTLFRIVLTKYGGSSVNLVSPSSGSHQYNVKWNGSIFTVLLNGATVASFGLNDRFAATRQLEFTPVGQFWSRMVLIIVGLNNIVEVSLFLKLLFHSVKHVFHLPIVCKS